MALDCNETRLAELAKQKAESISTDALTGKLEIMSLHRWLWYMQASALQNRKIGLILV